MNIINLTLSNIRRYIKSPHLILPMILLPLVIIFFVITTSNKDSDISSFEPPIALVCNINGKYENKLIKELRKNIDVFNIKDKNKAINLLKDNKVSSVILLDDNFSKDIDNLTPPSITSFKTSKGGGSLLTESYINTFVSKSLKSKKSNNDINIISSNIIEKKSFSFENSLIFVFMISYFMYLCSGMFCQDLLSLRKSNVLKRMLSTKNKDFEIIFSLCLSLFLVQAIVSSLVLISLNVLFGYEINIYMILLLFANSFVSTGLVIFICRIFKNESSAFFVTSMYALFSIILCLGKLAPSLNINIPLVDKVSMLSPFYWIFKTANGDNTFTSITALILIGLVFVTCGSFKLRDFAKN